MLELAKYGAVNIILLLCSSEVQILNLITKGVYFVLI